MASKANLEGNIAVSSKVFYPSHGAGTVISEKTIEFAGEKKLYYEFSFLNKQLTISTPVQNVDKLGIRPVYKADAIKDKIKQLKQKPEAEPDTHDYNSLMNKIRELDLQGEVDAFVSIIQYCNHEKKQRLAEGRLIPVSINKFIKNSVNHIVSELALSSGKDYDDALVDFEKITGLKV